MAMLRDRRAVATERSGARPASGVPPAAPARPHRAAARPCAAARVGVVHRQSAVRRPVAVRLRPEEVPVRQVVPERRRIAVPGRRVAVVLRRVAAPGRRVVAELRRVAVVRRPEEVPVRRVVMVLRAGVVKAGAPSRRACAAAPVARRRARAAEPGGPARPACAAARPRHAVRVVMPRPCRSSDPTTIARSGALEHAAVTLAVPELRARVDAHSEIGPRVVCASERRVTRVPRRARSARRGEVETPARVRRDAKVK
jgi:hypothetical protein